MGANSTRAPASDGLSMAIDRTTRAVGMTRGHDASWRFARCWLFLLRFQDAGRALADLDEALGDFDALPADLPGRGLLAAELTVAHIQGGLLTRQARFERVQRLLAIADGHPDLPPAWPSVRAAVRASELMRHVLNGVPGIDVQDARAELDDLVHTVGTTEPQATIVELARFAMRAHAMVQKADLSDVEQLAADMPRMVERLQATGISEPETEILISLVQTQAALARHDVTSLPSQMETFRHILARLPPGHPYRERLEVMIRMLESVVPMFMPGGRWDPVRWVPTTPVPGAGPVVEPLPPPDLASADSPQEAAVRWHSAGLRELAADPDSVDRLTRAVEFLGKAVDVSPEHDPRRSAYLMSLGTARLTRYETRPDRADLLAAIDAFENARVLAGVETHRVWTDCANPLAHAYRLDGRRDLGRQTALHGLRGHAWNALLQSRAADVAVAARNAAGDALAVAAWCLDDGDAAGAAAALDAGRALILYAATWRRGVESQVTNADLAERWRRACATGGADNVPASLRQQVIEAMTGVNKSSASLDQATSRLLNPPTLHEVRAALTALDVDALVYLMPGDGLAGAAVIVPARDGVSHVMLPKLARSRFEETERSLAEVSRGLADPRAADDDARRDLVRQSHGRLIDVCDWAWDAAIGPILERHLVAPGDRPLRVVLIPVGELSRVPWHAARHVIGATHEYALGRATFSYIPSARILCDIAWQPRVTGGDGTAALIVCDPFLASSTGPDSSTPDCDRGCWTVGARHNSLDGGWATSRPRMEAEPAARTEASRMTRSSPTVA